MVLDTNVLVNNPLAPESSFDDNIVIEPEILIEELDSLKRRPETEQSAQTALRVLKRLSERGDLRKGILLDNGGILLVFPRINERDFFGMERTPDNEIIATALLFQKANPDRTVNLISDDKAVLVKARYYGLNAEPYSPKSPVDTSIILEKEAEIILNEGAYQSLNENDFVVLEKDYLPNHVYRVRSSAIPGSFEECFTASDYRTLKRIRSDKLRIAGINRDDFRSKAAIEALLNPNIYLMCLLGIAGTGKTLLPLAAAIQQVEQKIYEEIIIARVPVPVGGKDNLGFLPGPLEEKQQPWMEPIRDDLWHLLKANRERPPFKDLMSRCNGNREQALKAAEEEFCISMTPFDYLQGRTFSDAFVIVDEAENMNQRKIIMVGTRLGEKVKLVFNGDIELEAVYSGAASNSFSLLAAASIDQPKASVIELTVPKRKVFAELSIIFKRLGYH